MFSVNWPVYMHTGCLWLPVVGIWKCSNGDHARNEYVHVCTCMRKSIQADGGEPDTGLLSIKVSNMVNACVLNWTG